MSDSIDRGLAMPETLDELRSVDVEESEFLRLLGYPKGHVPSERAIELLAWARGQYAEWGRPFIYQRRAKIRKEAGTLVIDGEEFRSENLQHLLADATHVALVAVSAGGGCEERAGRLWKESKPDEYYFMEVFGSAVVERLVALANSRICELAAQSGEIALPHYSPGYTGWDVADQNRLFDLIAHGMSRPYPEPLSVMPSGMLRPRKSLLAIVGIAPRPLHYLPGQHRTPCQSCSFAPCQFRRAPYMPSSPPIASARASVVHLTATSPGPLTRSANYTVGLKALRKWAKERVSISRYGDGSVEARFRFDGTTCSNLGRPLSFDYVVSLAPPADGYTIKTSTCQPAPGDQGHTFMCAYISDAAALMDSIAAERPLVGRPLDDVLSWAPTLSSSGCYCEAGSRTHKWVLALEAIHYTLATSDSGNPTFPCPGPLKTR